MGSSFIKDVFPDYVDRFICDEKGKKISVIITMKALQEFLDDIEDMYDARLVEEMLKGDVEFVPLEDVEQALTKET